MPSLFEQKYYAGAPLADRLRPADFTHFAGQKHLIGRGRPLRKLIDQDRLTSIIFWGPPGTGKTTLARIIANKSKAAFVEFSAVTAGINDLRRVVKEAEKNQNLYNQRTVLFVDEIHRFNKSQQDGFLPFIEKGTIILIGATTENPGFEIINALQSRSLIFELEKIADGEIKKIIHLALSNEKGLKKDNLTIGESAIKEIVRLANGDVRSALNILEMAASIKEKGSEILLEEITDASFRRLASGFKKSENHYDIISAFIKSMRGSDPDAAIYWLARMIENGEDPKFIARRMVIFASEDIGNAAPMALVLATATFEAVERIGLPEARINLAHCTTYLASAPKSNSAVVAIDQALADIRSGRDQSVPLHLQNAPTKYDKSRGAGKDYHYPHNYPGHYLKESYLPEKLKNRKYYRPTDQGVEKEIKKRLADLKKKPGKDKI